MKLFSRKIPAIGAANEIREIKPWLEVPFGSHPHSKGLQVLDRESALAVANEIKQTVKAGVIGKLFYIGHPDAKGYEHKYRDTKKMGTIVDAQVTENALLLKPVWEPETVELINSGEILFWSPFWLLYPAGKTQDGQSIIKPFRLESAGFTPTPRIEGLAVACEDEELEETKTQHGEDDMNLLERLVALINKEDVKSEDEIFSFVSKSIEGLKALKQSIEDRWSAEDAAYEAAENEDPGESLGKLFDHLQGKATAAANEIPEETSDKLKQAQDRVIDLTTALSAANEALASRDIPAAVKAGKIIPGDVEAWQDKYHADAVAAANELAAIEPQSALKTESTVSDLSGRDGQIRKEGEDLVAAANEALEKEGLPKTAANFDRVFRALRKTEQFKHLS